MKLKLITVLLASTMIVACTTAPEKEFVPPVFPAAPEQARFIYERTLFSSANVEVLTATEKFKRMATGVAKNARGMAKPYGVAAYKGRIYVTDTVQRSVHMYDIPGKRFKMFGTSGKGGLSKPLGIDVSASGEVFVCDNTAKRVVVYDSEGNFKRTIGGRSELVRPSSVAVDRAGKFAYVVDTGGVSNDKHRVQIFDAQSGELIKTVGTRGGADGDFNLPLQVSTDLDGNFYVVDSGNFRVQKFNAKGEHLLSFGSVGNKTGQFARPKGISTDNDGNVYVVDTSFANFQIFNSNGQLLLYIGDRSTIPEPAKYMLPAGIEVDEDGRIYIVDQYFKKVDIFRPYKLKADEGYAGVKEIK